MDINEKIKKLNLNSKIKIRLNNLKEKQRLYLQLQKNYKSSYLWLDLFITDNKAKNSLALKLAAEIRDKKELEIIQKNLDYIPKDININNNFKSYYLETIKYKKPKNYKYYITALNSFISFIGEIKSIEDISEKDIKEYVKSISHLSTHSQSGYLVCLKHIFNNAIKQNLIDKNPIDIKIKKKEPNKIFLNLDEINKIFQVEKDINIEVRNAFLFSCFTGLRISDIYNLKWSDIDNEYLLIHQQKTNTITKMKLSQSAKKILDLQYKKNDLVFKLPYYKYVRLNLNKIINQAGISKNITFHCARHTFATMCLTYDIDIYTVSKLLGHSNVTTTQIYAKLIDKKKDEAIDKLPKI